MRNWYRPLVLAATIGVAIGLGLALLRASHASPPQMEVEPLRAQITWPAGTRSAPGFRLRDQTGASTSLASLRGHTVLLTFLDSACKRECPVEGRVLAGVQRSLRGTETVTAVVSVDPWSDTGRTATAFATKSAWVGPWYWLLGSARRLAPVWRAYSVGVRREQGDVAHSTVLYLIDPHGYLRAGYLFPFSPSSVVRDVRTMASAS